jgi:hypothetical protein
LSLTFGGCDLHDEWALNDLPIPESSIIKCQLVLRNTPDYYVFIKFKNEMLKLYSTNLNPYNNTIFELRILISNMIGLPLSIFRLKSTLNVEMFDSYKLYAYNIFDSAFHLVNEYILLNFE